MWHTVCEQEFALLIKLYRSVSVDLQIIAATGVFVTGQINTMSDDTESYHNLPNCDSQPHPVKASRCSLDTFNPVRNIVENMRIAPNPAKKMIALSIGDPTIFGNLPVSEETVTSIQHAMAEGRCHGYLPSQGLGAAREAVARHFTTEHVPVTSDDVILTSGCSGALDLCIGVLAERNHNILIPRPGFSIYQTLSIVYGVEVKYYDLLPAENWEIDLLSLESQIDDKTDAIIVCNPSNPCGSVWTKTHILRILQVAEKHKLPIISDEVYADMVFSDTRFYSFGQVSTKVPVLVTGGLAKRWLAPGWRVGWIMVYDKMRQLEEVRKGLSNMSQRILGPNSLCQAAIPGILQTHESFYQETIRHIEGNARLAFTAFSAIEGLQPVMPSGAMYMMVGIDPLVFPGMDDLAFTQLLVEEQSVFCLPAKCFQYPGYFRIVLTLPAEQMKEACDRIKQFCDTHAHLKTIVEN